MIKEGDCFHGWKDFKDFINAGKEQIKEKYHV
jgi:hypothetical protein